MGIKLNEYAHVAVNTVTTAAAPAVAGPSGGSGRSTPEGTDTRKAGDGKPRHDPPSPPGGSSAARKPKQGST